ncbi:anti-anti-sigma factor [Stigmatella erecta]|uniref:Anti-anti-sigma factor n=1 Tax=Stigmatella erecta TaxID=83460 RepID=A0A1I0KDZ7_9BACT|nr:anti-anti-sigma factor [Stigmatella erecta]
MGLKDAPIKRTLTHRLEGLTFAQSAAERLCESVGAGGDAFHVGLAVREAAVNALQHGNRFDIDSSGIGELVSSYTRVTSRGGKLKLINLPPRVQDVLTITQLITVFEVYDTEADALASFS